RTAATTGGEAGAGGGTVAAFGRAGVGVQDQTVGQVDATQMVDLLDQHLDLVSDVDLVFDAFNAVIGQLGDMDQAFFAGHDLDEGAKAHDAGDFAVVNGTDLNLASEAFDHVDGALGVLGIGRADEHR